MGNTLTTAENDALVMWTYSDRSHDAFMAAVRHAIGRTEDSLERSEDFRLAAAERALTEISGMLDRFDTFGDAGRTRTFVGDLRGIVNEASR